ncbi:hypothetical protein DPEC_G00299690 [Dallia pectoralis]|uniref:Uncharacterized protein n=1 Tax=Dallia pectoralis TaxID=75939 RepID=A0ACC2FGJ7_DALPE|nr:hypothetical protein DPEC_G00299690 [Dallia pectoralis]
MGASSAAIGIAVGCSFLALLVLIGIMQYCCKNPCKKFKKKVPSMKEKVLTTVRPKKSSRLFSISGQNVK